MNKIISVSIVEDNRGTREGLVALLSRSEGLRCLAAYRTAEEALAAIPSQQPDIVLVDINLPKMSGIACVARLKQAMPELLLVMLTNYEEADKIFSSLRAGASGYLLKNMPPAELVQAIEQVHGGGAPMSMQIARKVVHHFHHTLRPGSDMEKLTPREEEILSLLAKGYLYKEISDQLHITVGTVRQRLHVVYEKLHVQSRTEAAVKYLEGVA